MEQLLTGLTSLDSEIRESVLLDLNTSINISNKLYQKEMLNKALHAIFDDIGNEGELQYKRSFNLLIIANLIDQHNIDPFLNTEEQEILKNSIRKYSRYELAAKGYTEYGWLHTVAHLGEVYISLCKSHIITSVDEFEEVFNLLFTKELVYINHEHTRIIKALTYLEVRDYKILENITLNKSFNVKNNNQEINYYNFLMQLNFFFKEDEITYLIEKHISKFHPYLYTL